MSDSATLVNLLRRRGIVDRRVLEAIGQTDRARFVPEEHLDAAWNDEALPIGGDQTISQPYVVALMTQAAALSDDDTVLEIGTGSGYQAAVLSRICRRVVTVERLPELAKRAQATLAALGCDSIEFRIDDGTLGAADDGPFDAILVTAGGPTVPPALLDQLAAGGRLVMPVGGAEVQDLAVVERTPQGFTRRSLGGCTFVRLIGEQGWEA